MSNGFVGVLVADMMGFDTVVERCPVVRQTQSEALSDAEYILGTLDDEEKQGVWVDTIAY